MNAPGRDEAAFLGFAIADRLLRLLVKKGLLSADEVAGMLDELGDDLDAERRHAAQQAEPIARAMAAEYRR